MSLKRFGLLILTAVIMWPLPVGAQQQGGAIVGFLNSGSTSALNKLWIAAFHRGLKSSGFVDGQNVAVEYRAADDQYDRLPGLAAELVRKNVAVIVAAGGPVSAIAAKKVTDTVPIVFTTIADPVKSGLVASLNQPGGNITGTAGLTSELDAKRLELLHELKPRAGTIGVLVNPKRPGVDGNKKELTAAAQAIGRQLIFENAGAEFPLAAAFEKLVAQGTEALVVTADPYFNFRRAEVIALAARYSLPAVYQWREFVLDGGLMSYGPNIADAYYQAGAYAGRIIHGAKPADLPVVQPTRFELVINQKTARSLGVDLPSVLLARADEVTE